MGRSQAGAEWLRWRPPRDRRGRRPPPRVHRCRRPARAPAEPPQTFLPFGERRVTPPTAAEAARRTRNRSVAIARGLGGRARRRRLGGALRRREPAQYADRSRSRKRLAEAAHHRRRRRATTAAAVGSASQPRRVEERVECAGREERQPLVSAEATRAERVARVFARRLARVAPPTASGALLAAAAAEPPPPSRAQSGGGGDGGGKRLFVFSFGCRSYFLQIWCRLHFRSVVGH